MTSYDNPTARVIRAEVEIAATPEQIWDAIATSEGATACFAPCEIEPREGGRYAAKFGPEFSEGTVTAYERPHRLGYVLPDGLPGFPDGAPPWAAEFLVEARDGGTCVVKVVSGFFENGEGWEEALAGMDHSWRNGLNTMRLYVTHFAGRRAAANIASFTQVDAPRDRVVAAVATAFGIEGAKPGDPFRTTGDAPALEGVVEQNNEDGVLLRATAPHEGLYEVSVHPAPEDKSFAMVFGFVYTEGAEGGAWQDWLTTSLPGLV